MLLACRELWDAVQEQLQSPIRQVRAIGGQIGSEIAPLAGLSALAYYTMLATPRIETRAVLAASWKRIEEMLVLSPATAFDGKQIEVQTLTYDPHVLAQNAVIDRIGFYLTIRGSPDERIAQAVEELLETFQW